METSPAKRKRPRTEAEQRRGKSTGPLCSFCRKTVAAVTIRPPPTAANRKSNLKSAPPEPFCVLHYYTTSAVRSNPAGVSILNQIELDKQLIPMQELFAESFLQLQQELSEQSARTFASHHDDPLAILHDLNKKRLKKTPPIVKKQVDKNAGGFMQDVPLPERLLRTQRQQATLQAQLTQRMNQAAIMQKETASGHTDISKRRKSSRKSIWNVIIDQDEKRSLQMSAAGAQAAEAANNSERCQSPTPDIRFSHGTSCSCGSAKVEIVGSSSSRNQDMAKGETWGSKDRSDEVMIRYRCNHCGKTWNEEE